MTPTPPLVLSYSAAVVVVFAGAVPQPCAAEPALAEDVTIPGLVVRCGDQIGAGALLRDFRADRAGGLLILTALHVIQGCREIQVSSVRCGDSETPLIESPWSASNPVEVLLWKRYELAALVVPDDQRPGFSGLRPFELASHIDPKALPEFDDELTLLAKAEANPCPRILAERRVIRPAGELYKTLGRMDYYALFGSLAASTTVVTYTGLVGEGASGAPVLWPDTRQKSLIAVHVGGLPFVLGWGVLLAKRELQEVLVTDGADAITRLDAEHPALLAQGVSALPAPGPATEDAVASLDVALNGDGFFAQVEGGSELSQLGVANAALQIGWTHQWASLPFAPLLGTIGTRLSVGGVTGLYSSPVFHDDVREQRGDGSARIPFGGGFVEAAAEVAFGRRSPLQWVAGLGVRGGVVRTPDVADDATHWTLGPRIYGRTQWRLNDRLSGTAQLHLTVERNPEAKTPNDCMGPSLALPATWNLWAGLAIGVELTP